MAPQSKVGSKTQKKNQSALQRPILKHPQSSFYVFFLLLKFNDEFKHDL